MVAAPDPTGTPGWCAGRVPSASHTRLASLAGDLVGLVLPVECAGCGRPDDPWCAVCRAWLDAPPWRCEERAGRLDRLDGRPPLPVWTLGDNVGAVRAAVVAWKDGGRLDLTRPLAAAVGRAAHRAGPSVDALRGPVDTLRGPVGSLRGPGRPHRRPLLVVPVPSTAAARRRRGTWLVDDLARGAVRGLTATGDAAARAPVLRRRGGRDQVGLGARERARNLDGQVVVARGRAVTLPGHDVLLVDDVLTTGASLAACAAVLAAAGARVVGALTLASTPAPGAASTPPSGGSGRPPPPPTRPGRPVPPAVPDPTSRPSVADWAAGRRRG